MTAFAAILCCHAQPKAIGTSYSFSGLGITYEHHLGSDCFINADVRAEMAALFIDRKNDSGISASVSCNFIIKEWKSRNDNTISIFAGPGIALGLSQDLYKEMGYFFGLKGKIGTECRFDRNISISIALNPVLGSHVIIMDEHIEMKYFKNGLINTILPEIGIKYTFGS